MCRCGVVLPLENVGVPPGLHNYCGLLTQDEHELKS